MGMNEIVFMKDIIAFIRSKNATFSHEECEQFLEQLFGVLSEGLLKEGEVKVNDLGTFKLSEISAAEDAETLSDTQSSNVVYYKMDFIPDETVTDSVNALFRYFEPTVLKEGVEFKDIPEVLKGEESQTSWRSTIFWIETAQENAIPTEPEQEAVLAKSPEYIVEDASIPPSISEMPSQVPDILTSSSNLRPKKGGSKKRLIWIPIVAGMIIASASLFFFNSSKKLKSEVVPRPAERSLDHALQVIAPKESSDSVRKRHSTVAEKKVVKKAILNEGQTLRLLALDQFGNKEFWVYIYLENRERISNPNRVPQGTELILPDTSQYSIDAEDAISVEKAKLLGKEVLKKFS